ncbi:hypothetical protein, partial [Aeromonas caviae]|uniref:hypothetical protein n=1 Tax=Aeromonas caviae TaxID=648 RepID=UPI001CC3520C
LSISPRIPSHCSQKPSISAQLPVQARQQQRGIFLFEQIGQLQLRQIGFTAPADLLEQEDAALLLARLNGELG